VPAAVIFDLSVGDPSRRPGADEGYAACVAASADVAEGRVGVGAGATVAKMWGPERAMPGGVGTWATHDGELVVGALVVVNAVGEIVAEDGSVLVGPKLEPGERREDLVEQLGSSSAANTTLGVVATNVVLSKEEVRRLASIGNDAFDVAIQPAHTIYDGDTAFALATQQLESSFDQVAGLVEPAVTTAIRRAVTRDEGSGASGS
jgi:L-aminopeptidase/D-esterase-like protein